MKKNYLLPALLLTLPLVIVTNSATGATVSRDKLGEVIEILDNTPTAETTTTIVTTKPAEEISADEMLAINRPALPATTTVAHDAKLALPKLSSLPIIGKITKPAPIAQTTIITQAVSATTGINNLKIGMSNYEVISDSVMGKPKKITRNITKDGLSEVWEYSDNVTLTFVNNSLEKISQAEVLQ